MAVDEVTAQAGRGLGVVIAVDLSADAPEPGEASRAYSYVASREMSTGSVDEVSAPGYQTKPLDDIASQDR
jgi:hypothetical protein